MDERLKLREHEGKELQHDVGSQVVAAIEGLSQTLRPRRRQVVRSDGVVEVRNFIGSVRLAGGAVLEVEPKVPTESAWPEAVVQLLTDSSRISVTGSQRSRQGDPRRDLTSVIAFEYARRLEIALAKEGPLHVFERRSHVSRRLNGQLDIGRYARGAWRDPALFPVQRDELTVANDFARGLSLVSRSFRRSVVDPALNARLRRLESEVIPGQALPAFLNPAVASRRLPAQWSGYRPAWDIAAAVLKNRSLINDPGHSAGLEVAIEPWPLLETLLERTLDTIARDTPSGLTVRAKTDYPLLKEGEKVRGEVIPDGVLEDASGIPVASFEAKYTNPSEHPKEAHRYQALATAAVLHSPLAVLVYPGDEPPRIYDVQGFNRQPAKLATVGLDLYRYQRTDGAATRASLILDILAAANAVDY